MSVAFALWQNGPLHDEGIVRRAIAALEDQQQGQKREHGQQRTRKHGQAQTVHSHKTQHGVASQKKLRGLFRSLQDELVPDASPLFLTTHAMAHVLGCDSPSLEIMHNALRHAGYSVGGSHTHPLAVVTDAPQRFQWDVMRAWVASGLASEPRCSSQPESAGYAILHGTTSHGDKASGKADVEVTQSCNDRLHRILLRDHSHSGRHRRQGRSPYFMPNPEPEWGPGRAPRR